MIASFFQNKILLSFGLAFIPFYFLVALFSNFTISFVLLGFSTLDLAFISLLLIYIIYFFIWLYFRDFHWEQRDFNLVLFFCFLFILVLSLTTLTPGSDFYHYFFEDVALVIHQQNPFFITPNDLPQEPVTHLGYWYFLPTQHGPFRIFLTSPLAWLTQGNIVAGIFVYRIFFAFFLLASILIFYKILQLLKIPNLFYIFLLFAWNPLIIYTTMINGGTDILMTFWFLLGCYFLIRRKFYWSTAALVLSILVKYVTAIFLPFFIIYFLSKEVGLKNKILCLVKHLCLTALITVFLYFPFWQGFDTLWGVIWVGNYFDYNSFLGSIIILLSFLRIPFEIYTLRLVFTIIFLIIYGLLLVKFLLLGNPQPKNVFICSFLALAAFLILGKFWFYSKYLVWLLPLIFLIDKKYYSLAVFLTGAVVLTPLTPPYLVILFLAPFFIFIFYYPISSLIKIIKYEDSNSHPNL